MTRNTEKSKNITERITGIGQRIDTLDKYDVTFGKLSEDLERMLGELEGIAPKIAAAVTAIDVESRQALARELEQAEKELGELQIQDAALDAEEESTREE